MKDWEELAQGVFDRMREANRAGRGVRISAEELDALSITILGEIWEQPNPLAPNHPPKGE